jgi:hypothetical protein
MNIDDWVIVIAHGKSFIGREGIGGTITGAPLSPVYELVTGMQMMQRSPREPPQMVTVRQCLPVMTFASITSLGLFEGIRIRVESLSDDERKSLAQSVAGCEELVKAMRAAESGILLAPPGTRVRDGGH